MNRKPYVTTERTGSGRVKKNKYTVPKVVGPCDICGRTKPLWRDHDHHSGRPRGLLCINCNLALGHVRDDPQILDSMIAYLLV